MDIYLSRDMNTDVIAIHTQKPKRARKCFIGIGHLADFDSDHAKAIFGISLKEGECIEGTLEIETK